MTTINPYNFVPMESKKPDRTIGYSGKFRLHDNHYSGQLAYTLTALSPIISLSQNRKEGQSKGFLKNGQGMPILQGASIKGMIRSVYEAITDSCLIFAATSGVSLKGNEKIKYNYADLGNYLSNKCNSLKTLCPACRLFGTIKDVLNCQGKVAFSDAILDKGELSSQRKILKELLSPKPHHYTTYGKGGLSSGPIAGRKFYYHQGANPNFSEEQSNNRSIVIEEYASVTSEFSFQIYLENLTKEELDKLLLAVELHEGLGHKIGLGKAIGLGSCRIAVDRKKSLITKAKDRYGSWNAGTVDDWYSLKAGRETLRESLIEVLRLNKAEDGNIAYPGYREYNTVPFNAPIDTLGVFGGSATKGGRPPLPEAVVSSPPQELPPKVKQSEKAAWLKEIYKDKLVFMDTQGKEIVRSRKGYQGKPSLPEVGKWYILSGTNASKRAP